MHLERYSFITEGEHINYEFISEGQNGKIRKAIFVKKAEEAAAFLKKNGAPFATKKLAEE